MLLVVSACAVRSPPAGETVHWSLLAGSVQDFQRSTNIGKWGQCVLAQESEQDKMRHRRSSCFLQDPALFDTDCERGCCVVVSLWQWSPSLFRPSSNMCLSTNKMIMLSMHAFPSILSKYVSDCTIRSRGYGSSTMFEEDRACTFERREIYMLVFFIQKWGQKLPFVLRCFDLFVSSDVVLWWCCQDSTVQAVTFHCDLTCIYRVLWSREGRWMDLSFAKRTRDTDYAKPWRVLVCVCVILVSAFLRYQRSAIFDCP